jgi:endonuclease-8
MPEGDTVWRAARRLHQALAGRPLTRAELRVPALATAQLAGLTVAEVAAYGKHLLTRFDGGTTLHSHLRMDGSWVVSAPSAARRGGPGHEIRVVLDNADWQVTGFRIHDLALVPTNAEGSLLGHLGPDILAADWNSAGLPAAAVRFAAQPERTVGEALLDQRLVAGIGNLYKSEALFVCGVNPWLPVEWASIEAVLQTASRMMRLNLEHPEQSTTGQLRRGTTHWVYGRAGRACLRCGQPIRSARQGEAPETRLTFWCPRCQPPG